MKISLNWLREYVELPESVDQLTEVLTLAGVEVEGVEPRGVLPDKVVVAQILASDRHPNADRLSVCKVDDGSGQLRQIVCGAKNYKIGDKVPLALPGAMLPGNFKIKAGKLRGVESAGMLCSANELELAEDATGLLILSPEVKVGTSMSRLFPPDTILDLEITPNRPDLLSHLGMAREVATLLGKPRVRTRGVDPETAPGGDPILLNADDNCPFYTVRRLSGVRVGPSPNWLCRKLEAVGLRPINNVVDITNFVMLEIGQPLHAFDVDKLDGGLQIRMASPGEELVALDGCTYVLRKEDVVIADSSRAVAIAGVMGGEESGVTESTREILLESAYFKPSSVRRTARDLQLMSESSYRFERGVDPIGVRVASQRAAELICELAHATEVSYSEAGKAPDRTRRVRLLENRCSEVLGVQVPFGLVDEILGSFGLEKTSDGWNIPSFRQDLTREIDLVEEVSRVFGIDRVPAREVARFVETTEADRVYDRNARLIHALVGQGFFEAKTVSLISEPASAATPFAKESVRRVKNPLVEDQVVLRPSLLPGLLEVAAHNIRTGNRNLRLFEIGRVFSNSEPEEQLQLALLMTGEVSARSWRSNETRELDVFDLKGAVIPLGLGKLDFEPLQKEGNEIVLGISIKVGGLEVGRAGQLPPHRARGMDSTAPVLVAEIDLSAFGPAVTTRRTFGGIKKFPAVSRDVAMLVPVDLAHAKVAAALARANEPLLENVVLFDVFTDPAGQKISSDMKSMAYSLTYRASNRTLTSDEVNAAHARLKELLKAELPVELRE